MSEDNKSTAGFTITSEPPTLRVYQPLPIDHPFYQTIGRVASEWAHFEHVLDMVIWELLSWKTKGLSRELMASITSQIMGVNPRYKAIKALGTAHGLDNTILKQFGTLNGNSFKVADWRARWLHDPWYSQRGPETPAQFRAMPAIDPRYGLRDIDGKDVEQTIDEIQKLRKKAIKLFDLVCSALRSSD